jgi:polyphosphate kinase
MSEADPVISLAGSEERYFNRELSWLAFNRRVLEEASNPAHPLLERLRFLSISGNNLDEFFMVRVAGLKGQQLDNVDLRSADGLTPAQQLAAIAVEADKLMREQQRVWHILHGDLKECGIEVIDTQPLSADVEAWLEEHFLTQIFPILTPQALDPAHPFPFIPNLGLSLLFDLIRKSDGENVRELVMIPSSLSRFFRIPGHPARYMALESAVRRFGHKLFPGYEVRESGIFRIIRDSDIEIEEEAEDLVRYFKSAIKRRRRGRIIRLEIEARVPDAVEDMLQELMHGQDALIADIDGFIGIGDLSALVEEDRPDLKFEPFSPRYPERIREHDGDCFAAIREKDIVVHHPYESFEVVVAFLRQAAADPDVVAIKQTLYRAGKQSAVIARADRRRRGGQVGHRGGRAEGALRRGAEPALGQRSNGRACRSSTASSTGRPTPRSRWWCGARARRCETYCHFGTGNYHPITARIYTDLSFFTADPRLGRDAALGVQLHHRLCRAARTELLTMSPLGLREALRADR